ncbi:hypothetical protein [Rhizobium leguminosarum]|uniref:hypothetical protein n=1 Tax=Rhizobium leguminosarum TaxID=384 RepID=UPI00155925EC|nr:hypothetical protein [Rhizobium leguminosarum]
MIEHRLNGAAKHLHEQPERHIGTLPAEILGCLRDDVNSMTTESSGSSPAAIPFT